MKIFNLLLVVCAFLFSMTQSVTAKERQYICTIKDYTELDSETGSLKRKTLLQSDFNRVFDAYVNQKFTINRKTGDIDGVISAVRMRVFHTGDQSSSYKAYDIDSNRLRYIVVNEFASTDDKPFLYVHHDWIFSGLCE
jgi:hypothetical protein